MAPKKKTPGFVEVTKLVDEGNNVFTELKIKLNLHQVVYFRIVENNQTRIVYNGMGFTIKENLDDLLS